MNRDRVSDGMTGGMLFVLFALGALSASCLGAQEFCISEKGMPKSAIVLGDKCTPVEEHAAKELAGYVKAIGGADVAVRREAEKRDDARCVLIGAPSTNSLIEKLLRDKTLDLPSADAGDAFAIKTVTDGERKSLVIAGRTERSCLYGVYHLLETIFDVGFFWDGEYVPKRDTVSLPMPTDLSVMPRFPIRQYLQECAFSYSCRTWSLEEWMRELDWAAKKKFNTVMAPEAHWCYNTTPDQVAAYARSIGLRPVFLSHGSGWWGVGEAYRKERPNCRYVQMHWWGDPPYWTLHPGEDAFVERGRQTIRPYVQKYGKGNIYCLDCYGEQTIHLPPEEIRPLRLDFAKSVWRAIREEDPEGRWFLWTWPFISPPWPAEDVKGFMEALPNGSAYICDAWAEWHPVYKKYDYFYGKDWGFSVLHLFGGDDSLRGDLTDLIGRVKDLATDPKAKQCVAFYICPEIIRYNTLYFELASALSLSPDGVQLEQFLDRYALRRYGRNSFGNMRLCLAKLRQSVYGATPGSDALYQKRFANPNAALMGAYLLDAARALRNVRFLEQALEIALRASDSQKGNTLYERDMVDIFRQYATELFNYHFLQMAKRASDCDLIGFQAERNIVRSIFDAQCRVLSVFPMYHVKPILESLKGSRHASADATLRIKDGMFTFARSKWLIDYQAKDMYELLKLYYGRRLAIYLDAVEAGLKSGNAIDEEKMREEFGKVEKEWLEKPIDIPESETFKGSVVDAVKTSLAGIKTCAPAVADQPVCGDGVALGRSVLWSEEFGDTSRWNMTHFSDGTFTSKEGIGSLQSGPKEGIVFGADLDVPCGPRPVLSFRARCVKRHYTESPLFTMWLTWETGSGATRRSRVWQEKDRPDGAWIEERLDVEAVLGVVDRPRRLKAIEMELPSDQIVEFDWMRIRSGT